MILKRNILIEPMIFGGGQEFGLRSGTENTLGILALNKANQTLNSELETNLEKVSKFRDWFINKIIHEKLPLKIRTYPHQVPHIINLSFPKIPATAFLTHLAKEQIYVSQGSACSEKSKKLSHALIALGWQPEEIKTTLRFSFDALEIPEDPTEFWNKFKNVILELSQYL